VDRPANNHCFCGSFILRVTRTVAPVGLCASFLALHMRMSPATNRVGTEIISRTHLILRHDELVKDDGDADLAG
jgi:hypothetical protein